MDPADQAARFLLTGPGPRWGQLVSSVTLVDVLVVLLVLAAAVRGWQLGLSRWALGVAGLLAGVLAGLWVALALVPAEVSRGTTLLVVAGFVLVAAVVGAVVGGALGALAARTLAAAHLDAPDRAAGGLTRGALAALVCSLLLAGVVALAPAPTASAASDVTAGSAVLSAISRTAPPLDEVRCVVSAMLPAAVAAPTR